MPWWGWVLLAVVVIGAYFAGCWWWIARAERMERTDWAAGLRRRPVDPVDQLCADWQSALGPDGSHDRDPDLSDEDRRQHIAYCKSLLGDPERSAT